MAAIATRTLCAVAKLPRPLIWSEAAMTLSRIGRTAAALWLMGNAASIARAESTRSQIGPEARATINISVSVLPTFKVIGGTEALNMTSNAPAQFRYEVVSQPIERQPL